MQPALSCTWLPSVQQEHCELLFCALFLHGIVTLFTFQRKKKVLHIMRLAKHSLMAADRHKNCVCIHCAAIKVNCNLFIISLNLIYCKMNSIYRCSNSCANHSSSHWTGLCFCLRHSSSCFRDQSMFPNFPKRWPCALRPAQPRAGGCGQPAWRRPAALPAPAPAGSQACSAEDAGTAHPIPVPPSSPGQPCAEGPCSQGQRLPRQHPASTGAQGVQPGAAQRQQSMLHSFGTYMVAF